VDGKKNHEKVGKFQIIEDLNDKPNIQSVEEEVEEG
jgi:hypothetical protein